VRVPSVCTEKETATELLRRVDTALGKANKKARKTRLIAPIFVIEISGLPHS
jgi:hypothetical protein